MLKSQMFHDSAIRRRSNTTYSARASSVNPSSVNYFFSPKKITIHYALTKTTLDQRSKIKLTSLHDLATSCSPCRSATSELKPAN